jgi:hypothetical protein
MATNDFLPFATGGTANVVTQAAYLADPVVGTGFQSGVAPSAKFNKALRQSSIISAMVAQFIADNQAANVVDDGTIATIEANFKIALNAAGITAAQFDNTTKAATTAFVQRALGNLQSAVGYGGSQTLLASQGGSLIEYSGAGAATFTLPSPVGLIGLQYVVSNNSTTGVLSLATPAGTFGPLVGGAVSFSIPPLAVQTVVSDGANWLLINSQSASSGPTNVFGSRALSTTYTNLTGRPLFVHARVIASSATASSISISVNGVSHSSTTTSVSGSGSQIAVIVPPRGTYSATISGTAALSEWVETSL